MARRLDRNEHTMRTWLQAYCLAGLAGLQHTPPPGGPATPGPPVTEQLEQLLGHSPSHCGSSEDGWTVHLRREDRANPHEAVRAATVRCYLPAGDWLYTRLATTVPRNAPSAENNQPGGPPWWPPSASVTRNGP